MLLHSTRPYLIRDGAAYCASCTRRRLARIVGTRFVCCPSCDAGQEIDAGPRRVVVAGTELLCGTCGRSALVAAPGSGVLECPTCDTPPWEHERVGQPAVVWEVLPGMETPDGAGEAQGEGARPPRPDPIVRECRRCRQTCWHRYQWRGGAWHPCCDGCGQRLSATRAAGVRGSTRRGARK